MPYPVENLIHDRPEPVVATPDASVSLALDLMIENDYSQLPVVDSQGRPLGLLTFDGILRGVRNFRTDLDQLHVRDAMSSVRTFDLEDDLFDLLEQLKLTNAVLITSGTGELVGVVTSYDSNEYFRSRAENLMHVEDIEVAIKEFILLAYTGANGEIDEEELAKAIARTGRNDSDRQPKAFDALSLAEYISLLGSKSTWKTFEPIFRMPWKSVHALLDAVRQTRNQLAHFKNEITAAQTDQLRFCAEWLARCRETYDQLHVPEEESQAIVVPQSQDGADTGSMPIVEETLPKDSKYTALADWLKSQPVQIDRVDLSFDQIEEIIGGNLPASAYKHRAWWANDSHSHTHSQLWLEVGWRRNRLNLTEHQVAFTRIRDREKLYIDFFSEARAQLEKEADFPIRPGSPDGGSWDTWQSISGPGPTQAVYTMSFSHGNRFRVELYIDTGDQETTKRIFDIIYADRSILESKLGKITWERIDKKRASRIAIYSHGSITDERPELEQLQKWAVDTAIAFYHAMTPIAHSAIKKVLAE